MAHGHIIISDETFRGYTLPDNVASFLGLPAEVADPADETGETMIPKAWTFYTGFFESGVNWPAGVPFPVKEDAEGVPDREIEESDATDWVVPMNAQFFNLAPLVAALAAAKPIPFHFVALRAADTRRYLEDGTMPDSLI